MAHVPKGDTAQLELLTFQDALNAANTPSPDYDIEKWLYAPNFYSEYRYILGTRGKNPLICIGINPSTAKPDALDNTLKSVERIALGNGFDSFIMFNVSRPVSPGMFSSSNTRSNASLVQASMASGPLVTVVTSYPLPCRNIMWALSSSISSSAQSNLCAIVNYSSLYSGSSRVYPSISGSGIFSRFSS